MGARKIRFGEKRIKKIIRKIHNFCTTDQQQQQQNETIVYVGAHSHIFE